MSWDQYSETPASNYISGYFLTGMAPSSVKVAGSDIMADLASRFAAMHTSGGTATAFTVTQTRQWAALVNGLELIWLPNATNTGAATLAVDGLAAKNLYAAGVAAIAGMVQINVPCHVKYDGTQLNILNPQRATGAYTGTGGGYAATAPSVTINYSIGTDGKSIEHYIPSVAGTSNATTATITGMPASLAPTTAQNGQMFIQDSGVQTNGAWLIAAAATTIQFGKGNGFGVGGFTNTGNKGAPFIPASGGVCTIKYPLSP
jgi:hypothetical protein